MPLGPLDLLSSHRGAASTDDQEPIGSSGDTGGCAAAIMPVLRQWATRLAVSPELPMVKRGCAFSLRSHRSRPACLKHGNIDAVEKNSSRTATRLAAKFFCGLVGLKCAEINQTNGKIRLLRKVQAEIGLVHGCRRVMRHRRMTVDPIDLAAGCREEIAEDNKPSQVGRGNANRNSLGGKDCPSNLQRAPDAAAVGRRVEGGADLVVHDLRRQLAHVGEDCRQMGRHPLRRARSRIAGEPNRLAVREPR